MEKQLPLCLKLIRLHDNSYPSLLIKFFKISNKSCDYEEFLEFVKFVASSNDLINDINDFTIDLFKKTSAEQIDCRELIKKYGFIQNLCKSCGICSSLYQNANSTNEEILLSCLLHNPKRYYEMFLNNGGDADVFKSVKTIIDENGKARAFTVVKDIYSCIFTDNATSNIKDSYLTIPDFSHLKSYNSISTKNIFMGLFSSILDIKVSDSVFTKTIKSILGMDISFDKYTRENNNLNSIRSTKNRKNSMSEQQELMPLSPSSSSSANQLSFAFSIFPQRPKDNNFVTSCVSEVMLPSTQTAEIPIQPTINEQEQNSNQNLTTCNPEGMLVVNTNLLNSDINPVNSAAITPHKQSSSETQLNNCNVNIKVIENLDTFTEIYSDLLSCRTLSIACNSSGYFALYYYINNSKESAVLALCDGNDPSVKSEIIKLISKNGICKVIDNLFELTAYIKDCNNVNDVMELKSLAYLKDRDILFLDTLEDRLKNINNINFDSSSYSEIANILKNNLDSSYIYRDTLKKKTYYGELFSCREQKKYIPLQNIFPLYNDHLSLSVGFAKLHHSFNDDKNFNRKVSISICNSDLSADSFTISGPIRKYLDNIDVIKWIIEQSTLSIINSKLGYNTKFIIDNITSNSISIICNDEYMPYNIDMLNQITITIFRNNVIPKIKPILNLSFN